MNIKKGKNVIADNVLVYSSTFTKAMGLMFSQPRNLLFVFGKEDIVPLHTFFVFYPIDIVFLSKNKKIVEIKKKMEPFSYYKPKNKAKYVIEFGNGFKQNMNIGNKLTF